MPDILVTLTDDEHTELAKYAAAWRRDVEAQAAVFIAEGMKVWNPKVTKESPEKARSAKPKPAALPRAIGEGTNA